MLAAAVALVLASLLVIKMLRASAAETQVSEQPQPPIISDKGLLRFATDAPQLSAIRIAAARELPVPLAEPLNARIAYNENVTTRVSSPVAGRIVALRSQPGDTVRQGDVLANIDSPELASAVSDVQKAESDEARKKAAQQRSSEMLEAGLLARKDFESARADLEQAQAEVQRARLRLRNITPAGAEDGRFALRSPLTGVVAERKANPGMEVRPDLADPLFVVTDTGNLWVIIDLLERDLAKVKPGKPVSVEVDAYPGERFAARIDKVGEILDPSTRRIQVRCSLANPGHRLKPEMYARVTLLADQGEQAVRVPNGALVTQGLYSYVFVETQPAVFQRRRVTLSVQDRDYSYVADGLAAGERVVTSGALLLNSQLSLGQ